MARAPRKPTATLFSEGEEAGPIIDATPAPPAADAPVPTTDIVLAEPVRGSVVLLDREKFDQFEQKLRDELADFVPDLTTEKGRREIASRAFRVTKVKTTLDGQAKALTEEWRKNTAAVNAGRREITDRLDAFSREVRKPLTEWEAAETTRKADNAATIAGMQNAAAVQPDDTSETVAARGREIWAKTFDAPQWDEDQAAEAQAVKDAAVAALVAAQRRLKQEEADRAELAALRAEREARELREAEERRQREEREAAELIERQRQEAEERAAREEAERREREAREAQERAEREQAEAEERERQAVERSRLAAEQAAAEARAEAEAQAQRDREEREAEHERQLAAERERAAAAERERAEAAAQAEREREEREARELREREARDAEAAEERRRQRDREHRKTVQAEAAAAIIEASGVTEDQARVIVLAIVGGSVPHCTVAF